MNKHTHRVVFSKARGAYVAVAETTRAQGKASKRVSVGVRHSAFATFAMGFAAAVRKVVWWRQAVPPSANLAT